MDKTETPAPSSEWQPRAIVIMIASFVCNGIIFGTINTYSIIYEVLHHRIEESGMEEASSKASLVGSLAIGMTFFMSILAGILTDKIGIRLTAFIGGLLATSGMLLSSLVIHSIEALYVTYGLMFGIGASLVYTPSLVILGHYFTQYLGVVNGIVTAGSSVFTMILPFLLGHLLESTSLEATLRVMGVMFSVSLVAAFLFKPVIQPSPETPQPRNKAGLRGTMRGIINIDIWKNKKYIIWAIAVPVSLTGYFVPYVHMVSFVRSRFEDGEGDGKILVMCIGITSGLGRLVFGKIADHPRVNKIVLQQISFVSIGVLTMCLTAISNFNVMIAAVLAMGIFDGCFISIIGPIAFELCGQKGATQGIGFILGIASIPMTFGPPLAGQIFDHTKSYTIPFILAGIPPIIGALILFLMRCVKDDDEIVKDPAAQSLQTLENGTPMTVIVNGECNGKHATQNEVPAEAASLRNSRGSNKSLEMNATEPESESLLEAVDKVAIKNLSK